MRPSEAEILAQVLQVRAELFPVLPAEISMTLEETAAVQIRAHLLHARLEMPPEEEERTALPLTHLLGLLVELIAHAEALSVPASSTGRARTTLLEAMRDAVLTGETAALRAVLERQRRAPSAPPAPLPEG